MEQLEINLSPISRISERFQTFHDKNPEVFERFKSLAFKAINRGKKKIGARQIIEVIRWEIYLETEGDKYKINNNFTPHYARLFVKMFPQYRDRFEFRALRS